MTKQKNVQMFIITKQNIKYALTEKKHSDSVNLLSTVYHEFLNVFNQNKADTLFPHQLQDYTINFISEVKSKHDPLYSIITDELKVFKK